MRIKASGLKRIAGVLTTAWGRTPVHWIWKKPVEPMDQVRIATSRLINRNWRNLQPGLFLILYFYLLAIWPARVFVLVLKNTWAYGKQVKYRFGIGYNRQVLTQLRMGLVRNNSPELYYKYELFSKERLSKDSQFITGNVASTLFSILNNHDTGLSLENKKVVSDLLVQRGFPAVSNVAIATANGIVAPNGDPIELPGMDFIVKPNEGMQGQSIYRFENIAPGVWQASDLAEFTEDQLRKLIAELATSMDFLIQPRLINHPTIIDLTGGGFSTLRVITGIGVSGVVEVVAAAFKMPVGRGVADNFAAGGIAAPIDLESGELGYAVPKKLLGEKYEHHPDTGGRICGRKLPFWNEIVEISMSAHLCYPKFVFLGWDIGIDESGPVVVETNALWDVELIQRPYMSPLGGTRFVDICNDHLCQLSSSSV